MLKQVHILKPDKDKIPDCRIIGLFLEMVTFIDLFAGIGGFRLGFESVGAKCVFSSEINDHAVSMYRANFKENSKRDITTLDVKNIPNFDILCAGFPCQAFSICGKQNGFKDKIRGTLFFDICRILEEKKPIAFILENVKNLEKHDKGNTLFMMIKALNEIGYSVNYRVLNARDFGVPQNRERIIIVGNRDGKIFDFDEVKGSLVTSMYDFLDKTGDFEYLNNDQYTLLNEDQLKKQKSGLIFCGYRNKRIRTIGVRCGTEHLSRVHKQPNRIYSANGIHPTIASQEQTGRYFIYVNGRVRKLTLNECYRFMGFPDDFLKTGKKTDLYERIGNSVCVPMIVAVAKEILNQFFDNEEKKSMKESEILERLYTDSLSLKSIDELKLNDEQKENIKTIVKKEEKNKGVYTVLVTSLFYKFLHREQDIRLHQANMRNGYSGRSFDTRVVTPFLKQKQFSAAMKESGWLTRSLEQNSPFTLDFPGKINDKDVKTAFLKILDDIETNNASPEEYLKAIFALSIKAKETNLIKTFITIEKESNLSINDIIILLERHFYYNYSNRSASILPVVALYSVYECAIEEELKRFENKCLKPLLSHYSYDKSSRNVGDIVVVDLNDNPYEAIEVKFEIEPDLIMLEDIYKKISNTPIQRYYVLSTRPPRNDELYKINELIDHIGKEHGCQVIVNGVIDTIKYYLRLLNTNLFMEKYIANVLNNNEINTEHKVVLKNIVEELYKVKIQQRFLLLETLNKS